MLKGIGLNFSLRAALSSGGLAAVTLLLNPASAADDVLVVPREQVPDWWVTEIKVAPSYPQEALQRLTEGCVAVGYIIEADGTTSGHRAIAAYPSRVFGRSGIQAAKKIHYTPSPKNTGRQAVFATNTFTYTLEPSYSAEDESGIAKSRALGDLCDAAVDETLSAMISETALNADDSPIVVPFGELGAWWVAGELAPPRYPIAQARKVIKGCAAIGFMIEADGTTSSLRAIISQPAEAFSGSAMEAIAQWAFTASDSNPEHRPVSTNVVVAFELTYGGERPADQRAADLAICDTAAAEDLASLKAPNAGS